ncbi:hypothetical protein [Nitrosomonas communis]|uniref:hypothetical protein n=1 Tax=Nitrosomonas communis TaxID=44574 RepID=UPI0026EBDB69|nr:hypothetical protein [Nitrosomonas communis]MCO6427222.1 hypothetical protein [Nitrosomonas communis]
MQWIDCDRFGSGSNYTFTYDANGNRLTADVSGVQVQYSYDLNSNWMNSLGGASVLLDAAGNMLSQRGLAMTYNQAKMSL